MSIAVILITNALVKRLPGYIVALLLGTIVVVPFKLPVETIGTRFGGDPVRAAPSARSAISLEHGPRVDFAGDHGRHAGRDRVADVGRGS